LAARKISCHLQNPKNWHLRNIFANNILVETKVKFNDKKDNRQECF
jgi:hypothetical protein